MAKLTKYVSDLTLRLGHIQSAGFLTPIRMSAEKAKAPQFKSVSPDGKPVKQVYQDDEGNIFQKGQLGKAAVVKDDNSLDETLVQIDVAAHAETKASSLPHNVVELTVHPAADVKDTLYPSESNGYVFTPDDNDPANVAYHQLLLKLVEDKDNVFLSVASVGKKGVGERLFQLSVWNERLVLQRVLYPHEVHQYTALPSYPMDNSSVETGRKIVASLIQPFDPDEYRNTVSERLAAMADAFADGDYEYAAPVKPEAAAFDLSAALNAFAAEVDA